MSHGRLSRCIRLLSLLQSRRGYRAAELAHELEVCRRTVYRDLRLLEEAGIAPRFDRRRAGYVVQTASRAKALPLVDDELIALLLAAHTSPLVSGYCFGSLVRQASKELLTQCPPQLREETTRLLNSLVVQPSASFRARGEEVIWCEIIRALRQERQLRISYPSPVDPTQLSLVTVAPRHLVASPEGWYLVGLCAPDNELRRFDLRRVQGVQTISDYAVRC